MPDIELGREYVRERVRRLLGDTSSKDAVSGAQGDYLVDFWYSDPERDQAETEVRVELPNHYDFELRLEYRASKRRDNFAIHGFTGTAAPAAVARLLIEKPMCERLVEQRVTYIRIAPFDIKAFLSRRTLRYIKELSHEEQYRSKYTVSVTVRGWIEDPDRAIATIALAVDLASRVPDAITRAAGAELAEGPYRDAPAERPRTSSDGRHRGIRRVVAAAYALLSRAVGGWWPS
jgi:hypothetical protein